MAKNETRRIAPSVLQADRDAWAALKTMAGYAPRKEEFSIGAIKGAVEALIAKGEIAAQKEAELDSARDDATAAEWAFHNLVLGAKGQVVAQFGDDSNELQTLGRKKKSEYKSPKAKNKPAPSPAPPK